MRRDINFFSVYRASSDRYSSNKFNSISLSILAGSFIIVLGIFSYLKIADLVIGSANNEQTAYLQSPAVAKAEQSYSAAKSKLAALNGYVQAAERVSAGFASLPKLDSPLLAAIAKAEPRDVQVSSLAFAGGALTLTCTSPEINSAAIFVHTLQKNDEFSNVNFSGVTKSAKYYAFTVMITLKGVSSK